MIEDGSHEDYSNWHTGESAHSDKAAEDPLKEEVHRSGGSRLRKTKALLLGAVAAGGLGVTTEQQAIGQDASEGKRIETSSQQHKESLAEKMKGQEATKWLGELGFKNWTVQEVVCGYDKNTGKCNSVQYILNVPREVRDKAVPRTVTPRYGHDIHLDVPRIVVVNVGGDFNVPGRPSYDKSQPTTHEDINSAAFRTHLNKELLRNFPGTFEVGEDGNPHLVGSK